MNLDHVIPVPTPGDRCTEMQRSLHHGDHPVQPKLGGNQQPFACLGIHADDF